MQDFIRALLLKPIANSVPVFFGHNADDGFKINCAHLPPTLNVTQELYEARLRKIFQELLVIQPVFVNAIMAQYPYQQCAVSGDQPRTLQQCCAALARAAMDYVWVCQKRSIMKKLHAQPAQPAMFDYLFDELPTCPITRATVDHTVELAYVFNTESDYLATGLEPPCSWSSSQQAFAAQVAAHWAAFTANGNPSTPSQPAPSFLPGGATQYLYLKRDAIGVGVYDSDQIARCDGFWEGMYDQMLTYEKSQ